jgi:hypothetical protein
MVIIPPEEEYVNSTMFNVGMVRSGGALSAREQKVVQSPEGGDTKIVSTAAV